MKIKQVPNYACRVGGMYYHRNPGAVIEECVGSGHQLDCGYQEWELGGPNVIFSEIIDVVDPKVTWGLIMKLYLHETAKPPRG